MYLCAKQLPGYMVSGEIATLQYLLQKLLKLPFVGVPLEDVDAISWGLLGREGSLLRTLPFRRR